MPTITLLMMNNDLDSAYHALMIANSAAKLGFKVNVFVLNKAIPLLLKGGSKRFRRIRGLSILEELYIKWIMRKMRVKRLDELLSDALKSGVNFYVDEFNLRALGKRGEDLIEGVKVAGVITFLKEATESNIVLTL